MIGLEILLNKLCSLSESMENATCQERHRSITLFLLNIHKKNIHRSFQIWVKTAVSRHKAIKKG
ncbi:hypothetical protein HMPREF0454_04911 [Hafnia alvei ATCC 51873]|uniref:Uncharacterized protein n=1 Tax=Hafnia alvei ATCC 51873 TaxID=1002364 RepID=G9YE62_HAFAL|nr:hypothetical protein HMPREF0454_04911 [Hafnia alvei ATCC 51873]